MSKSLEDARVDATNLLERVLENQPNLLVGPASHGATKGDQIAMFCKDFIETYASYLVSRKSE